MRGGQGSRLLQKGLKSACGLGAQIRITIPSPWHAKLGGLLEPPKPPGDGAKGQPCANALVLLSAGDGMNAYVAYKVSTQVCQTHRFFSQSKAAGLAFPFHVKPLVT